MPFHSVHIRTLTKAQLATRIVNLRLGVQFSRGGGWYITSNTTIASRSLVFLKLGMSVSEQLATSHFPFSTVPTVEFPQVLGS